MAGGGRSRNYPAFGLGIALDRARKLYEKDGRAAVPSEIAVQAWGYGGLNGASLRVLGAARQYGLIDTVGDKMVKLSHRALTILLEEDGSAEKVAAIQDAANDPAMFVELRQQYPDGLPSDPAMVSWLVRTHGFNEDAARGLIAAYRDTMALVQQAAPADIAPSAKTDDAPATGSASPERKPPVDPPTKGGNDASRGAVMEFTWALSATTTATLTVSKQLDADDIETLEDGFKMATKALRKAVQQNQSAPGAKPEADQ